MSVSDPGTDRESSVDRQNVTEDSSSYIESEGAERAPLGIHAGNIAPHKAEYLHSPRESDTTSDYGTMIGEGRRCNTSFLSDSGSEGDSRVLDETLDHDTSPRSQEANENHDDPHYFRVGEQNVSNHNEEGLDSIRPTGQDICKTDRARRRRGVVPSASSLSRTPIHVSNVVTGEHLDINSNSNSPLDQLVNLIQGDETALCESSSPKKENFQSDNDETSDANIQSQSDSSHFETPQQSPRDEENRLSKEETKEGVEEGIAKEGDLISVKIPDLKTVSVNTDDQSLKPPVPVETKDDNSLREVLKRELQQKIDRLQRNVPSRSDSAISSDYTDGDSTSVSPRGSRLYESDKTLRSGLLTELHLPLGSNIEVMTTQTDTSIDPTGAQSLPSQSKSLDIDNKVLRNHRSRTLAMFVTKTPLEVRPREISQIILTTKL